MWIEAEEISSILPFLAIEPRERALLGIHGPLIEIRREIHMDVDMNVDANLLQQHSQSPTRPDPVHVDRAARPVPGGNEELQDIDSSSPLQERTRFHHLLTGEAEAYLLSSLRSLGPGAYELLSVASMSDGNIKERVRELVMENANDQ